MEASTINVTADECDGNYKSKNITECEQRKALEMMKVEEGYSSIAISAIAAVAVKASARVYGNAAAVEALIARCER